MAIAGRVAIVPKGDYVNGTQYKRLDLVTYNGDGYVAKLDNINVVPEDGDTWMLAWHGAAADVTERISNLENLILPANTALNKNFETDASAYKENGTASVGTSENISRSDHVHPTDQTRLSKDGDSQDNTVTFISNDTSTSDTWTDVAVLATGEKHSSLFAKISTMFKNIRYIYTHFIKSENILETLEEIVANTQSGKVAGALAVKEINSNLNSLIKKKYYNWIKPDVDGIFAIPDIDGYIPIFAYIIYPSEDIKTFINIQYNPSNNIFYGKSSLGERGIEANVIYNKASW